MPNPSICACLSIKIVDLILLIGEGFSRTEIGEPPTVADTSQHKVLKAKLSLSEHGCKSNPCSEWIFSGVCVWRWVASVQWSWIIAVAMRLSVPWKCLGLLFSDMLVLVLLPWSSILGFFGRKLHVTCPLV